jgi:hypothetical protein
MLIVKTKKEFLAERRPLELRLISEAVDLSGTKTALAKILGFTDIVNITRWVSGKKPIPDKHLEAMMSLVNK